MLTHIEKQLCESAIIVRKNAYAPYSKFKVGVAILDESKNIHVGVNVENAAYPQGTCAEAGARASSLSQQFGAAGFFGRDVGTGGFVALVSPHLEEGTDERTRTPFANLVRLTSRNSFYQQWKMQEMVFRT